MPIDLADAVQDAIFSALNVPALTALAPVRQHVRQGTEPPLVIVAEIDLSPEGGKDGGIDRATVTVLTYVREPRRAALLELMAKVRELLDGGDISAAGAVLSPPVLENQTGGLMEDGQTYEGTQTFGLFVQAA